MGYKIYFDMDGVLAKWNQVPFEVVCTPGYFENLQADEKMIYIFIRLMMSEDFRNAVAVRSSVLTDKAAEEKRIWLKKHIPTLSDNNIFFVPYGTDKSNGLDFEKDTLFLIDDFSYNLHLWKGVGIKFYNGINGNKGTWTGYNINARMDVETMYRQLVGIIKSELEFDKIA